MTRLDGRVAIVTGGAVGLGAVYTKAMAGEGATVVIADVAAADATLAACEAAVGPGRVRAVETDVSDEAAVRKLIADVISSEGRIDVLVNNAAVFASLESEDVTAIDVELWDRVMAVNLRGPFLTIKHAAPHMIDRGYGKIINVASGVAYKGMPRLAHYASSKAALLGLTRSVARELGAHGICVNTLAPGLIMSDSIAANEAHVAEFRERVIASRALRRDGYPEDLIGALLFLASAESDFVTGQTIAVDGGSINT